MTRRGTDAVAIVGVGSTGFNRNSQRSLASLVTEAVVGALRDANLRAEAVDGVCGTIPPVPGWVTVSPDRLVNLLHIPEVSYLSRQPSPVGFSILDACNAVATGACDVAVVYHGVYRGPALSRSAASDPMRVALMRGRSYPADLEHLGGDYSAWAGRHFHDYGTRREHLGRVVLNSRYGSTRNSLSAASSPLTLDEYLSARMVREPLCLFDMDMPVDGADAFILTSAERAADLSNRSVTVHSISVGMVAPNAGDQASGLTRTAQHVVADRLRGRSDLWLDDVDVLFTYDGFSILTLCWLEAMGWCGVGESGALIEESWDESEQRILLRGSLPINPHGGALGEGATQGSGHVREAVTQLRGEAGDRQVSDAQTALLGIGGLFNNAQGMILRTPAAVN